jgi:hypothetical protein
VRALLIGSEEGREVEPIDQQPVCPRHHHADQRATGGSIYQPWPWNTRLGQKAMA